MKIGLNRKERMKREYAKTKKAKNVTKFTNEKRRAKNRKRTT